MAGMLKLYSGDVSSRCVLSFGSPQTSTCWYPNTGKLAGSCRRAGSGSLLQGNVQLYHMYSCNVYTVVLCIQLYHIYIVLQYVQLYRMHSCTIYIIVLYVQLHRMYSYAVCTVVPFVYLCHMYSCTVCTIIPYA